jgi:predicted Zn-dependent protease
VNRFHPLAPVAMGLLALLAATPALAIDEQAIGQQVYQQLAQKGEIISSSPLYSVLAPVAQRIKTVADPQYQYPFHFILVHESQPNAFAVPGGNVYVTDSLMHFVDNQDELAGVLCHETSHDIHHDVVNNMRKDQNVMIGATVLSMLFGRGQNPWANTGLGLGANAMTMNFSRSVESAADQKGSDTCAAAGYNPYGMVWLFQKFQKSGKGGSLEMMSDHPRDDHRVSDLETHFKQNPAVFGKYPNDMSKATPIKLPATDSTMTRPQSRYPGYPGQGGPPQQPPPGQYPPGQPPAQPPPGQPPAGDSSTY